MLLFKYFKNIKERRRLQKEAEDLQREAEKSELSLDELTTLRQLEAKLGHALGKLEAKLGHALGTIYKGCAKQCCGSGAFLTLDPGSHTHIFDTLMTNFGVKSTGDRKK